MKINVEAFIPEGKENAVTAHYLSKATNLNRRTVTILIRKARLKGAQICAASTGIGMGYYRATDEAEAEEYQARLQHRIAEIEKILKALKNRGADND